MMGEVAYSCEGMILGVKRGVVAHWVPIVKLANAALPIAKRK